MRAIDTMDPIIVTSPRRSTIKVPARTDHQNNFTAPLDFSFNGVSAFSEVNELSPRQRQSLISTEAMKSPKKTLIDTKNKKEESLSTKSLSKTLRINNNSLENWNGLSGLVANILVKPIQLSWLDLSFNRLVTIDCCLLEYPNLHVLYLHGNEVGDLRYVDILSGLDQLISLTLHGNPIEGISGYRPYILTKCCQLKNLDFSGVTKADLANALNWRTLCKDKSVRMKSKIPQH